MGVVLPNLITIIVLTITLIICAYTDFTKVTISPIILCSCLAIETGIRFLVYRDHDWVNSLLGAIIGFGVFFVLAVASKGGGGDALLMGTLGWCVGLYNFACVFVLTSGCYLLFFIGKAIIAKTQHTSMKEILQAQYPYAPFVLFGWIIFLLIGIFGG